MIEKIFAYVFFALSAMSGYYALNNESYSSFLWAVTIFALLFGIVWFIGAISR